MHVGHARRQVCASATRQPEGDVQYNAFCESRHCEAFSTLPGSCHHHCSPILLRSSPNSTFTQGEGTAGELLYPSCPFSVHFRVNKNSFFPFTEAHLSAFLLMNCRDTQIDILLPQIIIAAFDIFKLLQVLDYDNTATTLLPLVATSYVLHASGKAVWAAYELYESEKDQGRFETLPELHASSSGLKALCTECTADGIEAARRACGGHGYSVLSGLPTLYASYVQVCKNTARTGMACCPMSRAIRLCVRHA